MQPCINHLNAKCKHLRPTHLLLIVLICSTKIKHYVTISITFAALRAVMLRRYNIIEDSHDKLTFYEPGCVWHIFNFRLQSFYASHFPLPSYRLNIILLFIHYKRILWLAKCIEETVLIKSLWRCSFKPKTLLRRKKFPASLTMEWVNCYSTYYNL